MKAVQRILDPAVPDPSAQGSCALGIMTKAPRAGHVKTRLVPPLTHDEAAALNICFLRDTATAISRAYGDNARGVAVYTPVGSEGAYIDILPRSFRLMPQRGDAFGERLALAAEDLFQIGFASVCLIDSDSPTVRAEIYSQAVTQLAKPGNRIVLGPSGDGGYYLIGMKQLHRRLFQEIDWSTERVFNQTMERAAEIGAHVHQLSVGFDVDDRASLRRLCGELLGDDARSTIERAPSTREFLSRIIVREGRDRIWPEL
jgi:rSAM/selenodomain-associated transferase 1